MKKFFLSLGFVSLVFAGGFFGGHVPSVFSSSSLGNPDPMSKTCAASATRRQPNYCATNNGTLSLDNLNITNACTALNYTGSPNNWPTTTVWGRIYLIASTAGTNSSVGLNSMALTFYSDSGCTVQANGAWPITVFDREEVITNGSLSQQPFIFETNLASDGKFYYKISQTRCGSCAWFAAPMGYYD